MRAIDLYVDLVLLILLLTGGVIFVPAFARQTSTAYVSFNDDKTMITPSAEIKLNEDKISLETTPSGTSEYRQCYDGQMVALMLMIQDEYCPTDKIRVYKDETGYYDYVIDNNWLYDRYDIIEATYDTYLKPVVDNTMIVDYKPCKGRWVYYNDSVLGRLYFYQKNEGDCWVFRN